MSGEALLPRTNRRLVLMLVGAPLIAGAAAGVWTAGRAGWEGRAVSAASLLPASWLKTRPVEGRVSGLPWAPFQTAVRAASDQPGETRGEEPAVQRQRKGLVQLLAGDPRDAVATLETASSTNQPAVWSDLAAAYYEVALRHEVPEFLAKALAAADRALAIQPDHAEALFNRALALERLGLRRDARAAWSRYLAADSDSGWADEARKHLGAIPPQRPFLEMLDGDYERIGRDPAAAAALYERDRFGARGQGVVEVLGRWGHAVVAGDEGEAARHLSVGRQLGRVVSGGGDRTLEHAVAAIDRAGSRRTLLAAAHADFHTGMQKSGIKNPVEAEPLLRRAAEGFRQMGSPVAIPAALWAANSIYLQGRRDEAEKEYDRLLASTAREYPAYRAFMLWQLANCRNARGEWGAAIAFFEESASLFEALGETGNVANVRQILAAVYDRIGDPERAWKNRLAVLSGQGIRASEVDERMVWSVVEASIVRRDWHMASSFLTVYVEVVRRLGNDLELANGLLLRAVVRDRLDQPRGAGEDIAEAGAVAARIGDPSYQEMLRVNEWRTIGMLRSTPPATADELLTRAIDYEATLGHPSTIPGLLLLRARARRRANDPAGAMEDVERGIAQMERHRESLPAGAARWGAFHAAEELFEEAVDLAMNGGDREAAFRFIEKARARSLLDSYDVSPHLDRGSLPPRTAIVTYAALPASLVILVADGAGIHAERVAVTREALASEIGAFVTAVQEGDVRQAMRGGASIHRRMIQPVAARLEGVSTVVFVPDDVTSTVPFSALVDPAGEYLVEQHAIVVAPSASAFVAANERRLRMARPRSALVVTASAPTADAAELRFVDAEAERIVASYRSAFRIDDGMAQLDELAARAPGTDVIHFGGHAVGDARGYEPASIVLRNRGTERRVGVEELAALRLGRTAMVVLAGCSTARGQRRAAEGVISVAHGFLSAGVPTAVATLWPISDQSAAAFFPRLHEKLAAGMPPVEALRQVQREAIRKGDVPPSLWAAVQVIGS